MRERIARWYALGLGAVMVALAALFAERQNTEPVTRATATTAEAAPVVPPPADPPDPAEVQRGRTAFEEQGCLRCHRLEGEGSPRSPLDGVGARLTPEAIRAFIVAADEVRASLSPSVARQKTGYAQLPAAELDALVTFLAASRDGGGAP
jgi:mono/diheme cytochrome c family protein